MNTVELVMLLEALNNTHGKLVEKADSLKEKVIDALDDRFEKEENLHPAEPNGEEEENGRGGPVPLPTLADTPF